MKGTITHDGKTSEALIIVSGMKQADEVSPTLFRIVFYKILTFPIGDWTESAYICAHDRKLYSLYNLARLRAKTKVLMELIRGLHFADVAAIVAHSLRRNLHKLIDKYSYKAFQLTISIKKIQILVQGVLVQPPSQLLNKKQPSHESEISERIGKASGVFSNFEQKSEKIGICWSKPKMLYTTPAFLARSNTAVKHEPLVPCMRRDWTYTIHVASGAFLVSTEGTGFHRNSTV